MEASNDDTYFSSEAQSPTAHTTDNSIARNIEGEWVVEVEDDDMDFEPASNGSEDDVNSEPVESPDSESQDADNGTNGVEIEFSLFDDHPLTPTSGREINGESAEPTSEDLDSGARGITNVPNTHMLQLLGNAGMLRLFANHGAIRLVGLQNNDDSSSDNGYGLGNWKKRRSKCDKAKFPPVPSNEGRELMKSGIFGSSADAHNAIVRRKTLIHRDLMRRELGIGNQSPPRINEVISQGLIPSSKADIIIHYNSKCYSGQFSNDGNFFYCCAKDFKVRMYDTSNPYRWKYYKSVFYPFGNWTITDASLSPDNKYLAYASISSIVCLASTDRHGSGDPLLLNFSDIGQRDRGLRPNRGFHRFGIWSIRFSGDGREIVGGTSDNSVYVHDIETQKSTLRIRGHSNEVNAVCFGDASSPHILYSGSDDALIKVWDRRSMGDSREAGVFMGHREGLTYVDSKGDGRYVLSNGKDQLMKLWDLRKMMSTERASKLDPIVQDNNFDYRHMVYPVDKYEPHPNDCSVVTFRGHSVLRTLIRCHFSPPGSTNSRYVYSASEDGGVYIYNLDATLAAKLDVLEATRGSRPRDPDLLLDPYEMGDRRGQTSWRTCVRDAGWHPNAPIIAAASWNGWGGGTGTCTVHSWNDGVNEDEAEPKLGTRVNDQLEYDESLYENSRPKNTRSSQFRMRLRNLRAAATMDDTDEEH